MMQKLTKKHGLFVFIISFVVLMACQYTPAIIDYNARFVLFAQNALAHGLTYFPVINGLPYPDYPIGNTVLLYLFALPFGKLSIFSVGLPYCLTAALTLVLIYKLGALHNKERGLYAVLFSLFTWQYLYDIHTIAIDIYPVLAAVFCFYLVYSAKLTGAVKRLWFLPLGLLFGFFIRGPIGLIVPAAIVGCFYLLNKDWRAFIVFSIIAAILLVLGFGLLLWGAHSQGGYAFMHQVWMAEAFGRIHSHHKSRIYYYFSLGLLPYLFTIFFALAVIIRKFKTIIKPDSEQAKFLLYLTVWIAVVILGFTIPNTKQMRYILSIVPAISLLAAYTFVDMSGSQKVLLKSCFFMPVIGLIFIGVVLIHNHIAQIQWQGYFLPASIILLGLLGINIWLRSLPQMVRFILGVLAFLTIVVFLMYPIILHFKIPTEPAGQIVFLPYWPF